MGLGKTYSAVVVGVRAHIIEVEAHLSSGLPGLSLVGLPDPALNEARDRVRAAVVNSGLTWPNCRMTVSLSPAWLPKRGSGIDVSIAVAILAADGQIPAEAAARIVALGELGLDGRIRPAVGALATALAIRQSRGQLPEVVVAGPVDSVCLRSVPGLEVVEAASLRSLVARMRGDQEELETVSDDLTARDPVQATVIDAPQKDMADVRGQPLAKRALEIAAAGGHHVALLGRAGVGKTLLAERLPGLLPDLKDEEALEVTSIHQLTGKGLAIGKSGLATRPPWFAPHHTASRAAMVGGGTDARPSIGVVSLAHHGVLFLDEAAEFEPGVLDALREPLESGAVNIARSGFQLNFPAQFQLVLATNPCPCGNALDTHRGAICRCTPTQRRRYLGRLSGPLLDRIDVRVVLTKPSVASLAADVAQESSEVIAARVADARLCIQERLNELPWNLMVSVPSAELLSRWPLSPDSRRVLDAACRSDSMRGRDRVVRVAWSISALAGRAEPQPDDIDEAVALRASEQEWAA